MRKWDVKILNKKKGKKRRWGGQPNGKGNKHHDLGKASFKTQRVAWITGTPTQHSGMGRDRREVVKSEGKSGRGDWRTKWV